MIKLGKEADAGLRLRLCTRGSAWRLHRVGDDWRREQAMAIVGRRDFSNHAQQRIRQRGMSEHDIRVILSFGTAVDGDAVLLTEKDVNHATQLLTRLKNRKVILCGEGTVVTSYPTTRNHRKAVLRRARVIGAM
jgi:hypothetical protein